MGGTIAFSINNKVTDESYDLQLLTIATGLDGVSVD